MAAVLYNTAFGGFGVSEAAAYRLRELGVYVTVTVKVYDGEREVYVGDVPCPRHDLRLLQVFEEMGQAAAGSACILAVKHVGNQYRIDEYDGAECVETPDDIDWVYIAP
jgi:hypothetical protein